MTPYSYTHAHAHNQPIITQNMSKLNFKKSIYLVDDGVQLLLSVNVVVPIVRRYFQVAVFDHVRAVAFLTTYDLDFQLFEGNRYKPMNKKQQKYQIHKHTKEIYKTIILIC